jgi:site-specific DNA-methyltransferase (adenine-specific)
MGIRPVADFETINYQIMTHLNTSTEATITDEPAIGFIPCYTLAECTDKTTNEAQKIKNAKRGNISFFCIDNIEFMKTKPDKYYDLAIVDPPYGFANNAIPNNSANKKIYEGFAKKAWDNRPTAEYFTELKRVSKNQIVWGGNYFSELWQTGLNRGFIFWDKIQVSSNHADGELAWTSFDRNAKLFKYCWSGNRFGFESNIGGVGKKSNRIHPTQKPIDLYRWLLQNYAEKGMKILDTHGGSFTHAIACDMEGFELDICELDEEYYNNGLKAYDLYKTQLKLF